MATVVYPEKLVQEFPYLDKSKLSQRIMIHFLIAMLFPTLAGFYFFGFAMIRAMVVCISVCVLTERFCNVIMKKESTINDLTAIATGAVIALNMRPGLGVYPLILASIVGITVGKMIFGGVGFNPVNPAVVGRLVPVAGFPGLWAVAIRPTIPTLMDKAGLSYWQAVQYNLVADPRTLPFYHKVTSAQPAYTNYPFTDIINQSYDVLSGTTYLETVKNWYKSGVMPQTIHAPSEFFDYWTLFLGNMPGTLGETAKWAILLGFLYLVFTKIISPLVPILIWFFMGLFGWIFAAVRLGPFGVGSLGFFQGDPLIWILAGGAMLGSVYMETDPVSSPRTIKAKVLYSLFFVSVVTAIRLVFSFPEGVSFALLSSNLIIPFVDKLCDPKNKYASQINTGLNVAGIASIFLLLVAGVYQTFFYTPIYEQNIKKAIAGQEYTQIEVLISKLNHNTYYRILNHDKTIGTAFNVFDNDNLGDLVYTTIVIDKDKVVGLYIKDAPNKSKLIGTLAPNEKVQKQFIGKTYSQIMDDQTLFVLSNTDLSIEMIQKLIQKAFAQYQETKNTLK